MFEVDLHVHTTYSDGVSTPREVLEEARRRGLGGIAITDHDTARGACAALEDARRLGIVLIPGVEVSAREAHVLLLGVDCSEPPAVRKGMGVEEVLDLARDNGYVAVLAHPFSRLGIAPYPVVRMPHALRRFDLVEVLNGKSLMLSNRRAMRLAQRIGKPGVAGSDAHVAASVGVVRTALPNLENPDGWEDVVEELRRGRVEARGRTSILAIARHYLREYAALLPF